MAPKWMYDQLRLRACAWLLHGMVNLDTFHTWPRGLFADGLEDCQALRPNVLVLCSVPPIAFTILDGLSSIKIPYAPVMTPT